MQRAAECVHICIQLCGDAYEFSSKPSLLSIDVLFSSKQDLLCKYLHNIALSNCSLKPDLAFMCIMLLNLKHLHLQHQQLEQSATTISTKVYRYHGVG